MLSKMPVELFVDEVASSSPAPGGGSVAALAGAQAAALLAMYCNLSQNRDKLGDAVDLLKRVGEEARVLKRKLLEAIDEDTLAFNRVMEAYRLPKGNDEQKKERAAAIERAAINAAEVPLQTARDTLRLLALISEVAARGNPSAITDLGVANLQALAGLVGACYNVRINLAMIKEISIVEEFSKETKTIIEQGESLFQESRKVLENEF